MIINDLQLLIQFARSLQIKLQKNQSEEHHDEIVRLLKIIQNLDLKQQYSLQKKELSPELTKKCKLIYLLANRAIDEIEEKNYIPENVSAIIGRIINLEEEISTALILPTTSIRKILHYTPAEAFTKGFLFRGVSSADYQSLMEGKTIYAPHPQSNLTMTEHILNPEKAYDSPFISLTTDRKTAEHFGKVIVINKQFLRGHLYTPAEIESDLKRRAGKIKWTAPLRMQRKNSEFLLGPSRTEIAAITPESAINIRKLAA